MEEDLSICFKDHGNHRSFYKVRHDTDLLKLLKTYCKNRNVEYGTLDFLYNGVRLPRRSTVAQAGLKDRDEIDVMQPVGGGGGGAAPSNQAFN